MSRASVPVPSSGKKSTRSKPGAATRLVILVSTRKGAWLFHGDLRRKTWRVDGPHFLGHTISHLQIDPRDNRTLLAAAKTGHLGPTVFRSTNLGRTWKEAQHPPAFAKPTGALSARSVDHTFWLTPGHSSERDTWYAGTSPPGLFRSEDGYRLDRSTGPGADSAEGTWQRIGRKVPKRVGDIGFPMVVHPHDADTAWVFPMDGTDVWPRTSPDGRPAAFVTRNAGRSWQRLDQGLPESQAWWTCKRQAMIADTQAVPAQHLGTTSAELWIGRDEGASWSNITRHLPEIYAVEVAGLP